MVAKRLRKKDQEWEFLVEWSNGQPNAWVEKETLGGSHSALVAEFNQRNPSTPHGRTPRLPY